MNQAEVTSGSVTPWVDPALALPLLETVEDMPLSFSGAYLLGEERQVSGVVFVQHRTICWAVTNQRRGRLTDLLLQEGGAHATRQEVEQVYRHCQATRQPLGQALVDAGFVSANALREALQRHTCESLLVLSRVASVGAKWTPHDRPDYNATFTFTPAETFVALGAIQNRELAKRARATLRANAPDGCPAIAIVRDGGGTSIASHEPQSLGARGLHDLSRWATGLVDIAQAVCPSPRAVTVRDQQGGVVSWQTDHVVYAVICRSASELGYVTALRTR